MIGRTTVLTIQTPEGVAFTIPIASPISRCLALAVDLAVILALTILISQVVHFLSIAASGIPLLNDILSDFGNGFMIVAQFALAIFYGIITEWLWSGQTLGKRLMKLRVIDERGLSLGLKQIIIRNLFRLLDLLPSNFYLLGGFSCLVTQKCQRIGDIAAGTLVIRETRPFAPRFSELMEKDENSFAAKPHLESRLRQQVTPDEARIALDAVVRRNELEPRARLQLFEALANYYREMAEFPEEITIGLSDEQYVRNVVETLFRRAAT
ncbi:RDD family protein [Verrucomicrobiales bacterium BCK34]|nr:RDD family protein [Verrucomicrobiales bacterium BCK34]